MVDRGIGYLEEALKINSTLVEAHLSLWPAYLCAGDFEKANAQLKALIEKNYFPKPVLDFGYNLLAGADKDAIIFTNGDMDTYPLLALQQGKGIRADVRVVNVNLLNLLVRKIRTRSVGCADIVPGRSAGYPQAHSA